MFSLEIYNQLVPGDLTKGYRIAGTGTIDEDGKVGPIGGIRHKVVAADREKADFFFAPKDWTPPSGSPVINAGDAQDEARKIGSSMKVVPVASFEEAVAYLNALPAKSK
jgi:PDZ domain-containing protein